MFLVNDIYAGIIQIIPDERKQNMKKNLFGKTLGELIHIVKEAGLPAFTARQLAEWLYKHNISEIDKMSNLSKKARILLSETYKVGLQDYHTVQESVDGTRKYLFPSENGLFIESAYIPDKDRATLCLSTQVGCKMKCEFCMTGKQGFQGQLTAGDILNQIASLPEIDNLTNLVYMGMGEPFDNTDNVLKSLEILTSEWGYAMSPRRITVSTIGIISGIQEFLVSSDAHLAVSMHSPFEEERKKLMPIESIHHLNDVLKVIKDFDWGRQRRISFEYIMFKGFNDTPRHITEISRMLSGLRCRINLIRFHPIPGTSLQSSDEGVIIDFRDRLSAKGITTTIRASRGQDIFAACGLLSTEAKQA